MFILVIDYSAHYVMSVLYAFVSCFAASVLCSLLAKLCAVPNGLPVLDLLIAPAGEGLF